MIHSDPKQEASTLLQHQLSIDAWSDAEWERRTADLNELSIYQTWPYVELNSQGPLRTASRAALLDVDRIVVAAQLRIKRLPFIGGGVAEMEWAPLCAANVPDESFRAFLAGVRQHYCRERNLQVRIYPRSTYDRQLDAQRARTLAEEEFRPDPSTRPYHTYILDLSPDIESLRAALHRNWRSHLKSAERAGMSIDAGDGIELFDRFLVLYEAMWQVKRFRTGVNVRRLRLLQQGPSKSPLFHISIANAGGEDVAGTVCCTTGDSFHYFLGASAPQGRQGAAPGYLLQWHNICWARNRGFRWYDTGGFDRETAPSIEEFKRRMGGTPVIFPGCFVGPPGRGSLVAYSATEQLYRRARRFVSGR